MTYHFGEPPRPTKFEPTQVSTARGGTQDPIRRLLHFLSWERLTCSDLHRLADNSMWEEDRESCHRIIFCVDRQKRDPDGK